MDLVEEEESETGPFGSFLEICILPFSRSKAMDKVRDLFQSGNGEKITASCALAHSLEFISIVLPKVNDALHLSKSNPYDIICAKDEDREI